MHCCLLLPVIYYLPCFFCEQLQRESQSQLEKHASQLHQVRTNYHFAFTIPSPTLTFVTFFIVIICFYCQIRKNAHQRALEMSHKFAEAQSQTASVLLQATQQQVQAVEDLSVNVITDATEKTMQTALQSLSELCNACLANILPLCLSFFCLGSQHQDCPPQGRLVPQ